jgi:hypothetical protein
VPLGESGSHYAISTDVWGRLQSPRPLGGGVDVFRAADVTSPGAGTSVLALSGFNGLIGARVALGGRLPGAGRAIRLRQPTGNRWREEGSIDRNARQRIGIRVAHGAETGR